MTSRTSTFQTTLRRLVSVAFVPLLALGSAVPLSAETDTLSNQCITVGGVQRACVYYLSVGWGSGISWTAGGQLVDMSGDRWTNRVEIMLNRKWSSNTGWIQVLAVGDWQSHYWSVSGYDPTYGAWVRLCTVSPSGTKYCNAARYVQDNS